MGQPIETQSTGIERVRNHHFSMRGNALLGQEMFKVLDRARKLEEKGNHIYHLELGNPRFPPPHELINATVEAVQSFNVGYTSSAGLPELRQVLAERNSRLSGRHIPIDEVVISPANLLIAQFLDLTCDRGARVALFTPAFPSYYASIAHIGLEVVEVPLDPATGFDLAMGHVDQALAENPTAVMLNSANNPTGAIYSHDVMMYLARRCHEQGVWLFSDETYAEACYRMPFNSLIGLDYPQLVVIASFSKIFSIPGFRIGYAIARPDVAEKLALSNSTLISCLPAFTQLGCAAGVRVMDSYSETVRTHFGGLIEECMAIIDRAGILPHSSPRSGFYIFLDISGTGLDDITFCNRLLEERHTAVTPGRSFGEHYSSYVRVAVCGKRNDVINGVQELLAFSRELVESRGD